jgi:hypothetical protein
MTTESSKTYVMRNKDNGAVIECTERFLLQWIARGFEIIEVKSESFSQELSKLSMDGEL